MATRRMLCGSCAYYVPHAQAQAAGKPVRPHSGWCGHYNGHTYPGSLWCEWYQRIKSREAKVNGQ